MQAVVNKQKCASLTAKEPGVFLTVAGPVLPRHPSGMIDIRLPLERNEGDGPTSPHVR